MPYALATVGTTVFAGLADGEIWRSADRGDTWERLAVVTDKDWMRHAISVFGWLSPGELRLFEPGELAQAKAWTGGA